MVLWRSALTDGYLRVERCQQQPKVAPAKPSPKESDSSAGAEKQVEPEFRFEEGAEGLVMSENQIYLRLLALTRGLSRA